MRKADNLTTILCRCHESGNLNFLEPSGPLQACNRIALPFTVIKVHFNNAFMLLIMKEMFQLLLNLGGKKYHLKDPHSTPKNIKIDTCRYSFARCFPQK